VRRKAKGLYQLLLDGSRLPQNIKVRNTFMFLGLFYRKKGGTIMKKRTKRISLFLSILLVMQMVLQLSSVFAQTLMPPIKVNYAIKDQKNVVLTWEKASNAQYYFVYEVINGKRSIKTVTPILTYTLNNVAEGIHVYEVTSYNNTIGESPVAARVEVPLMDVTLTTPELTFSINNENDIKLSWSGVEYATTYDLYQVVNGTKTLVASTTNTNVEFLDRPDGEYSYEVIASSVHFGESEISNRVIVTIQTDSQAPVTTSNITDEWLTSDFVVEFTATDEKSDVDQTYYSINGAEFAEGTSFTVSEEGITPISFYSVDSNGNVEDKQSREVKIDKTAPVTSSNVSKDYLVELTAADGLSGVSTTYYSVNGSEYVEGTSFTVSEKEINEVSFYSVDQAGNVEEAKTIEVIIDKTAPTTVSNVTDTWNSEFTVNLTATDEASGVATTYYSVNNAEFVEGNSFKVEREGINVVAFYSVDHAGNIEEVKTVEVKIDKTAPTTTSNVPATWVTEDVTVTLTAEDQHSGVATTYYSINGSDFVEGTTFVVDKDGITEVSYYSVDKLGNEEAVKTAQVKVDKAAPHTTSNAPQGWVQDEVQVTLTASDELSGVEKTFYSINGSGFTEGKAFTVTEEGNYQISYYSIDQAGNKEEVKTEEVKIDKTAPTTTSNVPATWVSDDVTVTLTAEDQHSGVATTYYSINGSEYVEGTTFVVDKEGITEISYYSVDKLGNEEEVKTAQVKVDKTAPQTTSNAPQAWIQDQVQVNLTATDELSGVEKTYYAINGSEFHEGTSFTLTEEGSYQISYYSTDQAGNKEETQVTTVKIDKTAPTVSIEFENEYALDTSIILDFLAEDNLSGIATEEVTLNGKAYQKGDQISLTQPGEYKLALKVTDAAGLTTSIEKSFVVYIPVTLEVLPKVIKDNKGTFTVQASLPWKYWNYSFDVSSVTLNGVSAVADNKGLQKQAEKGQFKFDREDFEWATGDVNLEFRGYIDGKYLVVGKTTVEVKGDKKSGWPYYSWLDLIEDVKDYLEKRYN
jgi:large repetitive protein